MRRDVASTLIRRHFGTKCPLGKANTDANHNARTTFFFWCGGGGGGGGGVGLLFFSVLLYSQTKRSY